jgi:L-seryl-tRNA(Ser) seleniumtransferase
MLREPADSVRHRAELLARSLDGELSQARVVACEAAVGGGSLPGFALASFGVEVRVAEPDAIAARLRTGSTPVFCRVTETGVVFDVRTVADDQLPDLVRAIQYAREGGDFEDA